METNELAVQDVPIGSLHPDPKNPRRISERDLDRLKRSITEDPDFMRLRPVLARPDGTIYAGNMRWEAARALGWDEVPAIVTDDPEALIRKRAVKDNTQFGEWVEEDLGEYLNELAGLDDDLDVGALGLTDTTVRMLGLEAAAGVADVAAFPTSSVGEGPEVVAGRQKPAGAAESEAADKLPTDERLTTMMNAVIGQPFSIEKGEAEPRYGIPLYRTDQLLQRLPEGIRVWPGADAKVDDGESYYLYNYSPNGTWTDVPLERCMLSFFTDDRFLYRWIDNPAYYVSRLVHNKVTKAVEIDLSPYEAMPWVLRALAVYQSRWLARFMQNFGIQVVPRLLYPIDPDEDHKYENELVTLGLPDHIPVMAFNAQTGGNLKGQAGEDYLKLRGNGLRWFFGETGHTVGQLLVYGAKYWDQVEPMAQVPADTEVIALPTFLNMRAELGLPWRDH